MSPSTVPESVGEESKICNYDYVIKNNNLEKTLKIMEIIIRNETHPEENEF